MIKAIIKDGKVINTIVLEDGHNWTAPVGHTVVDIIDSDGVTGAAGDDYDGAKYVKPIQPEKPIGQKLKEKIHAIDSKSQSLIRDGFTYDGETFSLSDKAQANWAALLAANAAGLLTLPIEVSTKDDDAYMVTSLGFFSAALGAVIGTLQGGRALKLAAKKSANPIEVKDNR
jgi:hypothetical protein